MRPSQMPIVVTGLFTVIAVGSAISQECGSNLSEPVPRTYLNELVAARQGIRSSVTDTVGLAVHVIKGSDNTDGVFADFSNALIWTNTRYADAGVYFFICDWEEEDGASSYQMTQIDVLNAERFIDHRVNVYIVQRILDGGTSLGGFAHFPWFKDPEDRFVAVTSSGAKYGELISHEIGHYFGLLHTHETANGPEWVDGNNCKTAGDLLCDTPADPRLTNANVVACVYVGTETDPLGQQYTPDPALIMSYAPYGCRTEFSADQISLINVNDMLYYNDMVSHCENLPDLALRTEYASEKVSFLDSLHVPIAIQHTLDHPDVTDVTFYLSDTEFGEEMVMYTQDVILDPGTPEEQMIVTVPMPDGIIKGVKYVRIKVDAQRNFIESDERNNDSRITFELDNSVFRDAVVFPNPALDQLSVFYRSVGTNGRVTLEVYDAQGRNLQSDLGIKRNFEFYKKVDISMLSGGVYFLLLSVDDDYEMFKFIKR